MHMDDNKGLSYFFMGLGAGVALGMILAPKSGSETRGLLRDKALEGTDYVKRRTGDLRESAGDLVERGKTAVNRQKEQLSAAVDAGKQAYRETIASSGAAEPGPRSGDPTF
jgi:gas vesicle protein